MTNALAIAEDQTIAALENEGWTVDNRLAGGERIIGTKAELALTIRFDRNGSVKWAVARDIEGNTVEDVRGGANKFGRTVTMIENLGRM